MKKPYVRFFLFKCTFYRLVEERMKFAVRILFASSVFLLMYIGSYGQVTSFFQAQFNGGVTGCGYGPDYSSGGTGTLTVNIAPGSTIYKAWLFSGSEGPAANLTVTLNGNSLTYTPATQVSTTFNSVNYGGPSGVFAVDVSAIVSAGVNTYTLVVPYQGGPSNRYNDFYLYVAYANNTMPLVSTAIFLNSADMQPSVTDVFNMTYPMGTTNNIGMALFMGYACSAADGEGVSVNGTNLGNTYGPNSNSGNCAGPYGDFYYQNGTLSGLLDGNPDQAVNGPDAISNVQALVSNCTNSLTANFTHPNSDNAIYGIIFAYAGSNNTFDTTVCGTSPVQLNAPGATSWSPTTGLSCTSCSNPIATPTSSTVYIANVPGGCGTDSFKINVINNVTVAVNDTTICLNGTATLTATPSFAGGTYSWSPGGAATQSITVSPTTNTTYTVTYSTANCGTAVDSGIVTTGPGAGPAQFVTCYPTNNSATMAATGTGTWTAQAGNPGTATITTPSSPTTTITNFSTAGTYNFIWSNGTCSTTTSVTVTGNLYAGPDQPVNCLILLPGGTATMAAIGTGTWTAMAGNPGTATITAPTSPTTTITTFSAVGTYHFIWSNGICSDTAAVIVTIKPNAGPDQTILCAILPGGAATMAAIDTGTWSALAGNPGTATITTPTSPTTTITNFSTAGTYDFIWSAGGCADTAVVTVTAKPNAGPHDTICLNKSATLNATGTGIWASLTNPALTSITTPSSASTSVTGFTIVGSYSYTWTVSGCSDTTSVFVNSLPVVTPSVTNISCINATGVIYANAGGASPFTYQWSNATGADSITTTTPGALYTVTVTDKNQCSASASDSVSNLIIIMAIDSSIQNVSCYGYNDGKIKLNVSPAGNYTYAWSIAGNTDSISGLAPGSYQVTVTDPASGCSATGGPYTITSPGYDSLSITPLDTTIILGDTIQLGSTLTGTYPAITYSWTPGAGLSCTNCPNPALIPIVADTAGTMYQLVITYNNGCLVSDSTLIIVRPNDQIAIPDAFTPNGDGMNETFRILATSVKDFKMTIYDRWGVKVFESTDINYGWDGTYKGTPQPGEVYTFFFSITFLNGKTVSHEGSLTLLR